MEKEFIVEIDKESCIGCKLCTDGAPEYLAMTSGRKAVQHTQFAGETGYKKAKVFEKVCPSGAIKVMTSAEGY